MVMAKIDRAPILKVPTKPLPTAPAESNGPIAAIPNPGVCAKPSEFDLKDANDDGKLNADEFNTVVGKKAQVSDPDKFDRYDRDNDGYVTRTEDMLGKFTDQLRKSKLGLPDLSGKLRQDLDPGIAIIPKGPGIDLDPGIAVTPKGPGIDLDPGIVAKPKADTIPGV